jgi:hypothetical protein
MAITTLKTEKIVDAELNELFEKGKKHWLSPRETCLRLHGATRRTGSDPP